jgi:hypothetical protein
VDLNIDVAESKILLDSFLDRLLKGESKIDRHIFQGYPKTNFKWLFFKLSDALSVQCCVFSSIPIQNS